MAKFNVECELNEYRDPKGKAEGVKFNFRFDGHYADFTVTAPSVRTALDNLCSIESVDSAGHFFVTPFPVQIRNMTCWTYSDADGTFMRDDEGF